MSGSIYSHTHAVILQPRAISEKERLDLLHTIHAAHLEPQYSQLIYRHLNAVHVEGRRSKVLDVGTGTGLWALTLADAQPFADVLAVDADWSNWAALPSNHGNLDLETVDVDQPLPWSSNHFDVIHVKALASHIPGYQRLVERLARVLRPGGLLILVEPEVNYRSSSGDIASPPSLRTWNSRMREAYCSRGIDLVVPTLLPSYITGAGVFLSPYCRAANIPVGVLQTIGSHHTRGFATEDRVTSAQGHIPPSVVAACLHRHFPSVSGQGYGEVGDLLEACAIELTRGDARYYQRLYAVSAIKSH